MSQEQVLPERAYQPGLSAVRGRPGMYIGSTDTTGMHHMIEEVVICGLTEFHMGHCTHIAVSLIDDGGVTVEHDLKSPGTMKPARSRQCSGSPCARITPSLCMPTTVRPLEVVPD